MPEPRIPPGDRRQNGVLNAVTARVLGAATGGPPPNLFTTLGRHRGLYRRWLLFAAGLMPGGRLPRRDSELVILRVAHRTGCVYERRHHEPLARAAGLTEADLVAVGGSDPAPHWTPRQRVLIDATDQLLDSHTVDDPTWQELSRRCTEAQCIELPLLVGHYQMLAMTIGALRIQPDPPAGPRGPLGRLLARIAARGGPSAGRS